MLDETSLKIIVELCQDGRISNARLAKKLGISVLTVAKRINSMIEDGTIAIKAIPNPAKMGYLVNAFIALKAFPPKINDICNILTEFPHVSLVVTCFGRFDILILADFHNFSILQNFVKNDLSEIDGINKIETYLVAESRKRYQGMFANDRAENQEAALDNIDKKLIDVLVHSGRPNYADLAKQMGISVSTVSRRISSLIKEDIIRIQAFPNPAKLGYSANAFVVLHADQDQIDKICDQLSNCPEVHLVMKLMNDYDILFGINCLNFQNLCNFMSNITTHLEGIRDSETFIRGDFFYFSVDAMFAPSLICH